MSAPRTQTVNFTTNADGDAVEIAASERGTLVEVIYIPDATDTPDAGADLTLEGLETGRVILGPALNIGATRKEYMPRRPTHEPDGSAILHALTGSPVSEPMRLAHERLQLTIASGGNTKSGALLLIYE